MSSKKEIEKELAIALDEIGQITPWYDKRVKAWIFSSPLYPSVEYGGETKEEAIKNYPLYLKEFIKHRLKNNIEPSVEKKTKGMAGYRPEVTVSCGNVYADFGYPNPEEMLAKAEQVMQISDAIKQKKITKKAVAALLEVDQAKLADILRGRFRDLPLDRLVSCVSHINS